MDHGISGNARKHRTLDRCCVDLTGDLEHDVHCADFLNVFAVLTVQPEYLGVAKLLCLYLS